MNEDEYSDIFDGFGNGSLHIYLADSSYTFGYPATGEAYYIKLDFHFSDWEALFSVALGCPEYDQHVEGEDSNECQERNRRRFQQSLPEQQMLSRIFDMYEDYLFSTEEVAQLREECSKLMGVVVHPPAVKALRKLIFACNKASQENRQLLFICD